jgi:hypothetical protein
MIVKALLIVMIAVIIGSLCAQFECFAEGGDYNVKVDEEACCCYRTLEYSCQKRKKQLF